MYVPGHEENLLEFVLCFSFLQCVASSPAREQFNFRDLPLTHLYKGKCSQVTWHTPLWPWRQQSPGRGSRCAWKRAHISLSRAQGRSAGSPLSGNLHNVLGPARQPAMTQSVLSCRNQAQGSHRTAVRMFQREKILTKAFRPSYWMPGLPDPCLRRKASKPHHVRNNKLGVVSRILILNLRIKWSIHKQTI